MLNASTPLAIRCAIRVVITLVFPLPAPAMIINGPLICSTACRCGSFSSSKYLGMPQMYEGIAAAGELWGNICLYLFN